MEQYYHCIKCGSFEICDLWFITEINEGRQEQLCDICREEFMRRTKNE